MQHRKFRTRRPSPLTYFGPSHRSRDFLRFAEVREAAGIELAEAERICRTLLEAHRSALVAVARRLLEHGRIEGREVERLLQSRRRPTAAPSEP